MNAQDSHHTPSQQSNAIRFTVIAAMFAAFFAAGWVMQYLLNTYWTMAGYPDLKIAIWEFVINGSSVLGNLSNDAMLVVVTRFILGFGCLWLPIAGVMAGLSALFNNRSMPATPPQTPANETVQP